MAVHGQSCEVLNSDEAKAFLAEFSDAIPFQEGKAWFGLPGVIRFAIGDTFTVLLSDEQASAAIRDRIADPEQRCLLLRKLADGGGFRLFIADFLRHLGPDFGHVADWIRSLPADEPRMVRKLGRVSVAAAVKLADKWSVAQARKAARAPGQGRTGEPFEPGTGRVWIELLDADALSAESGMMAHCVRSYADRLNEGTRIFSLRDWQGKAAVTAEFLSVAEALAVRQIRARGNAIPGRDVRADIGALLNHLNVNSDAIGEAATAGLCLDAGGCWRSVTDVSERVAFAGFECLGVGKTLYLMSPTHPDAMVAAGIGGPAWWRQAPGFYGPCLLRACGDRPFGLADQRAIARFANALDTGLAHLQFAFLKRRDDAWLPWADACETRDVDGMECLVDDTGRVHLPKHADPTQILAVIGMVPKQHGEWGPDERLAMLPVEGERDWSAEEVRRVARFLTAFGLRAIDTSDGGLRKAGLDLRPDGRWDRLGDHLKTHPCPLACADGRVLTWHVAPWVAYLKQGDRLLVTIYRDEAGRLRDYQGFPRDAAEIAEVARFATEIGMLPAPNWSEASYGPQRWQNVLRGPPAALMPIAGKWVAATGDGEVIRILAKAIGKRRPKDPVLVELVCGLFPPVGHAPDADGLLARCLAAWMRGQRTGILRYASTMRGRFFADLSPKMRKRETFPGRMADAFTLMDRMDATDKAAVARAVTICIRGCIGRTKRPKSIFGYDVDLVHALLRDFWPWLDAKVIERAVPWSFGLSSSLMTTAPEIKARRLEPSWVALMESLPPRSRARAAMIRSVESALFSLAARCDAERPQPETPDEAITWIRCIEAAMQSAWRTPLVDGAAALAASVSVRAAAEDDADMRRAWAGAAERIARARATLAAMEAADEAARARRQSGFMAA